jgi:Domain of unknown function (DUF4351)
MADHDQRFKNLLREFFREFLVLFFPQKAAGFDLTAIEWLDQEVFVEPPQGERRYLDLLAKLRKTQPGSGQRTGDSDDELALIHIEIESADTVEPLRSRMHQYYERTRARHSLPVMPIALYLRVGLDGLGIDVYEEWFEELRVLLFQYYYIGLPALAAANYVGGDNWLGVALAALMNVERERRAWLTTEAMTRLVDCPLSDQQRFLLCECVQAYSPMNEQDWQEFQKLLVTEPYQRKQMMVTTMRDHIIAEGKQQGQRELLLNLLEARFGSLSDTVIQRLQGWPKERLPDLGLSLLKAQSLKELGLEE